MRNARAITLTALAAIAMVLVRAVPAFAHTYLVSATPASNATVARTPFLIRLVFSEPIEAKLATIRLAAPNGDTIELKASPDPHNVYAVIADATPGASGAYSVVWHVVSADGHPVHGAYKVHVSDDAPPLTAQTPTSDTAAPPTPSTPDTASTADAMDQSAMTPSALPIRLAALRAAASFATLAVAGVLAFMAWLFPPRRIEGPDDRVKRSRMRADWLSAAALLLTAAHAFSWAGYASDHAGWDAAWTALMSTAGRAECARVVLCALTVWSLLLVRNVKWAAVSATGALLATAAIGHSAAFRPDLLIPIKAVHLGSAALWLGGLLFLALGPDPDDNNGSSYATLALRVSVVALTSVILVSISGIAQTLIVLKPAQLFNTAYGLLSLGKAGVLIILIGFGVANRLRNVPAVQRGEAIHVLRRTVTWEIAVVAIAFVIAGALAYTAPPEQNHHQTETRK